MRIMVVDQSSTMRTLICSALKGLGEVEMETACNGEDALSKVRAFCPQLVLLDWNMPRMSGVEFLKQFRTHDKTTPVVMVTTDADKQRVMEAIEAGVEDYILKPFTKEGLLERVNIVLEKNKAA